MSISQMLPEALAAKYREYLKPFEGHTQEILDLLVMHPHIAALVSSRIVEMGSNSNGHYVRWENGLQVCWRQEQLGAVQDFPDTFNNLADRTYPAMFSSAPVVQISVGVQSDSSSVRGAFYIAGVGGSSGWGRLCLVRHGSATGSTQTVDAFFVAIGRWK